MAWMTKVGRIKESNPHNLIRVFRALEKTIRIGAVHIFGNLIPEGRCFTEKTHFQATDRWHCVIEFCMNPSRLNQVSRYYAKEGVPPVTWPYAFIGIDQHLDSYLEANWQLVQLTKQSCYMGIMRHIHHAPTAAFWTGEVFNGSPGKAYCRSQAIR